MNRNLPVIALLLGSALWGISWIPIKYFGDAGIDGVSLTLVGYGAVTLVLFPALIKQYPAWRQHQKYIWIILGLSGFANIAFTTAIMYGDVIRVMVLFYLIPAWGVLGGWFFLNEKIDRIRGITVVFALTGAFLVLGGFDAFNSPPSWLDVFALGSGFALSMNNIAFRASPHLPLTSKIAAVFLGSFLLAALLIVTNVQTMPVVSYTLWFTLIAFVGCWIFFATFCTQWAVTRMEVGRASILIIMELITAVVSAMWIGGERMSGLEMFGGLLILIAAVVETKQRTIPGMSNKNKSTEKRG